MIVFFTDMTRGSTAHRRSRYVYFNRQISSFQVPGIFETHDDEAQNSTGWTSPRQVRADTQGTFEHCGRMPRLAVGCALSGFSTFGTPGQQSRLPYVQSWHQSRCPSEHSGHVRKVLAATTQSVVRFQGGAQVRLDSAHRQGATGRHE